MGRNDSNQEPRVKVVVRYSYLSPTLRQDKERWVYFRGSFEEQRLCTCGIT